MIQIPICAPESRSPSQDVIEHRIAHSVNRVVVPVWDVVYPVALLVPLELLQRKLREGQQAPLRFDDDSAQPRLSRPSTAWAASSSRDRFA